MNEKQQQLTFDKGITTAPSDAICSDNALEDCVGMVYMDGEHKPIQNLYAKITDFKKDGVSMTGVTISYIHKHDSQERYIGIHDNGNQHDIVYFTKVGLNLIYQDTLQEKISKTNISSIGKTLIISDENGIHYYVWNDSRYKAYQDIPMPDISFKMSEPSISWHPGEQINPPYSGYRLTTNDIIDADGDIVGDKREDWNNIVLGLYAQNKELAKEKCVFIGPFFVRAAVKLNGGTYTKCTPPILMVPNLKDNTIFNWYFAGKMLSHDKEDLIVAKTYASRLLYKLNTDYSDLRDIVEGVTIFVSEQVETMNLTDNVPPISSCFDNGVSWNMYGIYEKDNVIKRVGKEFIMERTHPLGYEYDNIKILQSRPNNVINEELKEVSLFYKLADVNLGSLSWEYIDEVAKEGTLKNLTTQDRLTDGYYDNTQLFGYIYTYNSRLNIANAVRTIFNGYDKFMPYDRWHEYNSQQIMDDADIRVYVTIDAEGKTYIAKKSYNTREKHGIWFYYPDTRAKHVTIFNHSIGKCILDEDLTEHKGLNGAYYFRGLPFDEDYNETYIQGISEPSDIPDTQCESLPNTIITSEVDNPWSFKAEGYNDVGIGKVIAITTNTQALSQGQFGQHPLLVFTDSGIWAMETDKTGLFSNIHPMNREICVSSESVIQTDDNVFFASKKGLMKIVGKDVVCVSEQLTGKSSNPFANTLIDSLMAYDYRDSLLWMIRGRYAFVYNLKTSTFTRFDFGDGVSIVKTINNYPDYLVQQGNTLLSYIERPNINEDVVNYSGEIKTRPMKLENALALKSILGMQHIKSLSNGAGMTLIIEASNNLKSWVELKSLRGMPWKYYRFTYTFTNLKAVDSFAGTILITQERRTLKLR